MPSKRVSLKGKGADLFFGDYTPPNQADADPIEDAAPIATPPDDAPATTPASDERPAPSAAERATPRSRRRTQTSKAASNGASGHTIDRASTLASPQAIASVETIEAIRKVVKAPGREVSFVRLTPEEKTRLGDLVYTFKRQGQKTTENEINRIALNYLLHDFQEHGERSVLARVLAALLA